MSRSVHLLAQVIGLISQVTHRLGAGGGLDTQRGPSGHYLPLQKDADIFMCAFVNLFYGYASCMHASVLLGTCRCSCA